eukprot:4775819-Pyramimonas_sp.AAC.1
MGPPRKVDCSSSTWSLRRCHTFSDGGCALRCDALRPPQRVATQRASPPSAPRGMGIWRQATWAFVASPRMQWTTAAQPISYDVSGVVAATAARKDMLVNMSL